MEADGSKRNSERGGGGLKGMLLCVLKKGGGSWVKEIFRVHAVVSFKTF